MSLKFKSKIHYGLGLKNESAKTRRKKLDKLFSQAIKARDKKCLKCGKQEGGAAHLYSKGRYTRMRYDTDNAIWLCWNCHLNFAHKEPLLFAEWLAAHIDPKRLARLKLRSQTTDSSPIDYSAIEIFLKQELKKYV